MGGKDENDVWITSVGRGGTTVPSNQDVMTSTTAQDTWSVIITDMGRRSAITLECMIDCIGVRLGFQKRSGYVPLANRWSVWRMPTLGHNDTFATGFDHPLPTIPRHDASGPRLSNWWRSVAPYSPANLYTPPDHPLHAPRPATPKQHKICHLHPPCLLTTLTSVSVPITPSHALFNTHLELIHCLVCAIVEEAASSTLPPTSISNGTGTAIGKSLVTIQVIRNAAEALEPVGWQNVAMLLSMLELLLWHGV
ncbi:hypothetical protein C0995_013234 [Termitomyces sp. Mi166|nr:hypothetical protein C0995_013234 [Termitomyces sp. Mi166\